MAEPCATPGTIPTDGPALVTKTIGLFRALSRKDQPEDPVAFVLIGTTCFLGLGFLSLSMASAWRIWTKGDLGAGALSAVTATGASLALLIAYVRGRSQ